MAQTKTPNKRVLQALKRWSKDPISVVKWLNDVLAILVISTYLVSLSLIMLIEPARLLHGAVLHCLPNLPFSSPGEPGGEFPISPQNYGGVWPSLEVVPICICGT